MRCLIPAICKSYCWNAVAAMMLSLMAVILLGCLPLLAANNSSAAGQHSPDQLIVLTRELSDADAGELFAQFNCSIIEKIAQSLYVVKVTSGALDAAEQALKGDARVDILQRNYKLWKCGLSNGTANDPLFPSQGHLQVVRAPQAWRVTTGNPFSIAVLDSGVKKIDFVNGWVLNCYDTATNTWALSNDTTGHGTIVATLAGALGDNDKGGVGVCPYTGILPIRISKNGSTTDSANLLEGIIRAFTVPTMIIPFNGIPPYTLSNQEINPVIHRYLRFRYDGTGRAPAMGSPYGLTFCAAGNNGMFDPGPRVPHLIVVSALKGSNRLASFSNWGTPVWFTAPGVNLVTKDHRNQTVSVSGTSFATGLVAAASHMLHYRGTAPGMTNGAARLNVLVTTASNLGSPEKFGYGLINVEKAVVSAYDN